MILEAELEEGAGTVEVDEVTCVGFSLMTVAVRFSTCDADVSWEGADERGSAASSSSRIMPIPVRCGNGLELTWFGSRVDGTD